MKTEILKEAVELIANHPSTRFYQNDNGSWHLETNMNIKDQEVIKALRKLLSEAQY